ncbi:uncharacterized protein LOC131638265 [Vicia villosa]|uniref:uncharacterized protein LOC131638265 n=1 Tax=Vicia villosa TaxID=3911 RepID=UPI00273AECD1|nr:uncharacterized protein LOC131638265 [Vicia villosa]
MVRRYQDADQVLRNAKNMLGRNNIKNVVEEVLACNGLNLGLHRPNYSSPLPDYIWQAELPRGCKVPKFTKFVGQINESSVEHIARYEIEAGDIANDEGLKMRYFLSSLTKNAFTGFTTVAPTSIRFRLLKARCFTRVPEHELVEMAAGGLDYSIMKKLDTQYLRDMAQDLVHKALKDERLQFSEKPKNSMKIDIDPLHFADANMVERFEVLML